MASTIKFDLSGASVGGGNFSVGSSISVGSTATETLKTAAPSFDVAGKGTFFAGATDNIVSFTADDALAGQTVEFANGKDKEVTLGTATFTNGNDIVSLSVPSVKAYMGKGDDLVYATKNSSLGTVFLGEGKDTVQLQADASLKVADYNYADGDVLVMLGSDLSKVKDNLRAQAANLSSFDAITVGGATVSAADDGNGVFKVRVQDTVGNGVEYWGATSNKTVNMDGTTFGTDTTLILDGTKAKSAVIMGGFGNDSIYVQGGGNTVAIQKAGGNDTVTGFTTVAAASVGGDMANYKGDTLWFAGGSLADVSLNNKDAIFLNNGSASAAATLAGVVGQDVGLGKVTFDGTNVKNVMYDNSGTAAKMDASVKGVDAYLGKADGKSTLVAGYKDVSGTVNLWDTDSYQKISYVSLSAGKTDETVTFVGKKDGGATLDAGKYTGAVNVLTSGAANDVSLNAGASLSDTIWWGGLSAAQDSVYGFEGGYEKKSDVLYLYDTADISGIKSVSSLGSSAKETKLELANGKSLYTSLTAAGDEVQVKFAGADAAKRVAFDNGSGVVTLTAAADYILGQSATRTSSSATKVSLSGGYTDSAAINLWDTTANRNVLDVDAGSASLASEVLVVGSQTGTSYVTLNGGVTSQVWTANKGANEVTVTGGDKATIWYAGSYDGNDQVNGDGASVSTYKLWDAASFDDIVKDYKFSVDGTNKKAVLKGADGSLTVALGASSVSGFKVEDSAGNVYKANLASSGNVNFATDVAIYGGGANTLAFNSTYKGDEADIVLGGTFAGKSYDSGISVVNGLDTQGKLVVVGNTDKGTTFYGGKQENAFWGASADSDTFYGNTLAVDTFWYSTQDGNDTFSGATGGQDSVYLYGISSNDIDTVITNYEVTSDKAVLTFDNKSTLTISGTALTGGLTFTTNDGVSYKYDAAAKKLAKA